jgi:hypothetical protein
MLNVLTYNVSWEAMSNADSKTVQGAKTCSDECRTNVAKLINDKSIEYDIDLIGTQETGRLASEIDADIYLNMKKYTKLGLYQSNDNMEFALGTDDKSKCGIMMMYNNIKFENVTNIDFNTEDNMIYGNIQNHQHFKIDDKGERRPFQAILLRDRSNNDEILFINLHNNHNGHYNIQKIQESLDYICITINNLKKNKLKSYENVVITGDFNSDLIRLRKELTLQTKKLNIYSIKQKTCCDNYLIGKMSCDGRYDNVLTSYVIYNYDPSLKDQFGISFLKAKPDPEDAEDPNHANPNPINIKYSDHLPVFVSLKKKLVSISASASAPALPAAAPPAPALPATRYQEYKFGGYYEKYLKYRNKYLALKSSIV